MLEHKEVVHKYTTHLCPWRILFLIVQCVNKRLCACVWLMFYIKNANVDNKLSKDVDTYEFDVI
jgi:hypothetical protein